MQPIDDYTQRKIDEAQKLPAARIALKDAQAAGQGIAAAERDVFTSERARTIANARLIERGHKPLPAQD